MPVLLSSTSELCLDTTRPCWTSICSCQLTDRHQEADSSANTIQVLCPFTRKSVNSRSRITPRTNLWCRLCTRTLSLVPTAWFLAMVSLLTAVEGSFKEVSASKVIWAMWWRSLCKSVIALFILMNAMASLWKNSMKTTYTNRQRILTLIFWTLSDWIIDKRVVLRTALLILCTMITISNLIKPWKASSLTSSIKPLWRTPISSIDNLCNRIMVTCINSRIELCKVVTAYKGTKLWPWKIEISNHLSTKVIWNLKLSMKRLYHYSRISSSKSPIIQWVSMIHLKNKRTIRPKSVATNRQEEPHKSKPTVMTHMMFLRLSLNPTTSHAIRLSYPIHQMISLSEDNLTKTRWMLLVNSTTPNYHRD